MQTNKECEFCGAEYVPKNSQYKTQKYCSKACKGKAQRKRDSFVDKPRKGGYPRQTHIRLWMRAQKEDETVPCHYCGKRLWPDNFCIDHKKPIKLLKTREEIMDESNLVISCSECNQLKGAISYNQFMKLMRRGNE